MAAAAASIQWAYIGRTFGRLIRRSILPLWYLLFSLRMIQVYVGESQLGCDFRVYHRALELWLSGKDPWSAVADIGGEAHFAAPPSALFPLLPFAPLGEDLAVGLWLVLCVACAVFVVRRLRLPAVWYAFPPLVVGVLSGNPSIPVLALLVAGGAFLPAVAAALKIYAVIPMVAEKRWRAIAVAVALAVAMFAAAPGVWIDYVRRFGEISSRLTAEAAGGYSATGWLPLVPPTLVALLVIARYDLRAAGWLAVPAIFPGSEWHWSTLALVVATPWLGFLLAPNVRGLPAVAAWVYAANVWYRSKDGAGVRARVERVAHRFHRAGGPLPSITPPAPQHAGD